MLVRALLDTAVDGIIVIDPAGAVQMFNPACEKLFGYEADEVIGKNVKMLMPDSFANQHDQYLRNNRETGERKIIGIGRQVEGKRRDGTTFPMHLSVGEAIQDGVSTFVGIIHDLTERETATQALKETAARLQAVVATAVDGVILIDSQGTIQMFNPACEKLFRYTQDEVTGRNVKILMPPPFHDEHDGYLKNFRETGNRKIIGIGREVIGRRADGTTFPMHLSVGEARQKGKSVFVGIIHDLTEHKRTEEQLIQAQKMETVGQLSGGMAHDFNNLLTVIIGNAEALRDKLKMRPDLSQMCDSIMGAGDRGAELTRRLLAFSRRQTLQPVVVDCNGLVESMRVLLRRTLRDDIEIKISRDMDRVRAFADAAQLESAILNLALNAQDAMPGGGCLAISTGTASLDERYRDTHPEVLPGDYVMISVTDDGEGMSESVRERAFEPFFTTKEVGKGSGLGLSMVYGFIKQSNGHVSIYSEPELGTTVRLYLPIVKAGVPAGKTANTAAEPEPEKGSGTVLIVEDDLFVRGYAVATLESLGYHVLTAVDGRDALTKLERGLMVDVLFSDVVMPGGVNGWELGERAQKLCPELKVLLTSGYSLETLAARSRRDSNFVVLNKPYRKAELARRIRELVDR
jgi:PAS domain S-box-containing protein